jgi:hypothetical protein
VFAVVLGVDVDPRGVVVVGLRVVVEVVGN